MLNEKTIYCNCLIFSFFTFSKDVITVEQFKADQTLLEKYLYQCKNGEIHPNDLICLNAKKAKRHLLLDAERARLSAK